MSTDIERAGNTPQQLPATRRKLSRREFTIGALTTLGLTAATLMELTSPKQSNAQESSQRITLEQAEAQLALLEESLDKAKSRGVSARDGALIESESTGEFLKCFVIATDIAWLDRNDYRGILHVSEASSNGSMPPLKPLPARAALTSAVGLALIDKTAFVYGSKNSMGAIEYPNPTLEHTQTFTLTSASKDVTPGGITQVEVADNKTLITLSGNFEPVFGLHIIKLKQVSTSVEPSQDIEVKIKAPIASILLSKRKDPANPNIRTLYSVQDDHKGSTTNGLYVRKINLSTGEVVSETQVDKTILDNQAPAGSYLDPASNKEKLLFVNGGTLHIVVPESPQDNIYIPKTVLEAKTGSNVQIENAAFTASGDIIVNGSYYDKGATILKFFVAKILKDRNANTDPNAVISIYTEDLNNVASGTIRLARGGEIALFSTKYGEAKINLVGTPKLTFLNKEMTTVTPPPASAKIHIPTVTDQFSY